MASVGQPAESLSLKVWELKVSIHCAGCQKKIKKILNHIEGVIETEIHASQNKVTVKGIVDSEVLIKKLAKHGKHAQLIPQPKPSTIETKSIPETKPPIPESKQSPKNPEKLTSTIESTKTTAIDNPAEESKEEHSPKPSETSATTETKVTEESKVIEDKKQEKTEAPNSVKQPEKAEAKETKEAAEKSENRHKEIKEEVSVKSLDVSDDGKQKKLELQPVYHHYNQPVYMQEPQLSYNMVQPSVSNAYYASPMEAETRGQEYVYSSGYNYYGQPSMEGNESTMSMFSEENPNGCNLM